MYPHDLIERAVQSATHCEAQGFHETAKSLRALAEEMRATCAPSFAVAGFGDAPAPRFQQRT